MTNKTPNIAKIPAIASDAGRGVTAVLGPTNTGKTHMAIERMVAYSSGVIGLPLRLLAREVYDRVVEKVGVEHVSLITGEERITPPKARFQVCTVEAMPRKMDVAFVAIDEVQLATDLERGHVFTDRLLSLRGREETLLLGASTIEARLRDLLPGIHVISKPRMSVLSWAGSKKISRLPRRSAIVAFSADEVYAIAEFIRRQRGGAAVILGALSPRTRNAQVELYQSGDVDFLVATDAIGMGLNLDVEHIAFAQEYKFDGYQRRRLTAAEFAQIAGRAGRHTQDGTFGVTGRVTPLEEPLIEALESHRFQSVKTLQWRNSSLNFTTLDMLFRSLDVAPNRIELSKAPPSVDYIALSNLARDGEVVARADSPKAVELLWQICQIPDFRRIAPANHAQLLGRLFLDISEFGHIDEKWFADQVRQCNNMNGEIDTLSNRVAHIRTWTYISNRADWLANPLHWREKTREIEDRLSDSLHERLTKRFVDRRTSVLMKRLRENAMLEAEITQSGDVLVEGHHVGQLQGLRFIADPAAAGQDAKTTKTAALKALASEIDSRAERLIAGANSDFILGQDGAVRWNGDVVAKATAGEEVLKPRIILLADDQLSGNLRERVVLRLERWMSFYIETELKLLIDLKSADELQGLARGVAYQIYENFGIVPRDKIADDVKSLDQETRGVLRKRGVRFGLYHIFVPMLLKPAPVTLLTLLKALFDDQLETPGVSELPQMNAAGRTSVAVDPTFNKDYYALSGYRVLGKKAVRVDILERLADLIRPAMEWRAERQATYVEGAYSGNGFVVTPAMMSILGATHDDMDEILSVLGYRCDTKPAKEVEAQVAQLQKTGDKAEAAVDAEAPTEIAETAETGAPVAEVAPAKEGAEPAEAEPAEAVEEKTVKIWRYHRGQMNRAAGGEKPKQNWRKEGGKPQGKPLGKPSGNYKGKPENANGRKPSNNNKSAGYKGNQKPKEKPMDPDSPFAKLAMLKDSMKK